ncbi:hypothetical protein ACFXD5_09815, partial [Streptomyces sp. NPDC059385]
VWVGSEIASTAGGAIVRAPARRRRVLAPPPRPGTGGDPFGAFAAADQNLLRAVLDGLRARL